MITKRITGRRDGRASAADALRYGEGLKRDKLTGKYLDKSHRTRIGNFGLVDDGVYVGRDIEEMAELIDLAATEMQANCDLNTKVGADKKIAHFIVSFNQAKPSEAVLRDTEDSMLSALKLDSNHFATFLHDDNGYWHLHIFASRIDKIKHVGNSLWQDKTIRDRVCKEIELRYGLQRDNGLHRIDEAGQIVEVPRDERRKRQEVKSIVTDKARTTEIHSGEISFQSWAEEIRIGDRLKHAKSWQDLHMAAAAYGCNIKQKGAGFIICPHGEKGGIQLSRVGLKKLPAKFGDFLPPRLGRQQINPVAAYKPTPTNEKAANHYSAWRTSKKAFLPLKTEQINELRERHIAVRKELKEIHRGELSEIRSKTSGDVRFAAVSVAKMQQAIQMISLSDQFKQERKSLYKELATHGPGNTFRDYLMREAQKGDNVALGLARKYGIDEATAVSREREANHLRIRAAITGSEYQPALRLRFTHFVEPSGSVVYQLGHDRQIIDSAVARMIQLNDAAAIDPEAIETALRFATLKFGSTLSLTGPAEFQRLAVETAVREKLGIRFTDPALEAYRLKLTEQQNSITFPRYKETSHASNHRVEQLRQTPPAHIRNRLHNLSLGDLVLDTSRDIGPLRSDVSYRLDQQEEGHDRAMQRTAGRATRTGDAFGRPWPGTHVNGEREGVGNGGEKVPLTVSMPVIREQVDTSAQSWSEEWAKVNGKEIVEPRAGNGRVPFKVIYVRPDGIVLDLGRTIAIYSIPADHGLRVGDKVTVGKHLEILLQPKGVGLEQQR